jgi:hypothetical protein
MAAIPQPSPSLQDLSPLQSFLESAPSARYSVPAIVLNAAFLGGKVFMASKGYHDSLPLDFSQSLRDVSLQIATNIPDVLMAGGAVAMLGAFVSFFFNRKSN